MKTPSVKPFFLSCPDRRLFCLSIQANAALQNFSPVLFIPPFAEEMNKSRHIIRNLAQLLAEAGFDSLIFDPFGTGDSEGDFGDATWEFWIEDLNSAYQWLARESGKPVSIIALRTGALLASEYIQRTHPDVDRLIFLAPVVRGDHFLSQFLRLRIATEMAENSRDKSTVKSLKETLLSGKSVEVAGYTLNPGLARGMTGSAIQGGHFHERDIQTMDWIELVAEEDRPLPILNNQVVEELTAADLTITLHRFCGPAFWSAVELVELPELLELIRKLLLGR